MPSRTAEDYLKTILMLQIRLQAAAVPPGDLAAALGVSPGTVTAMLKTLAEARLIEYKPYQGARLNHAGRVLATRVLRRHRLLELFLAQTLKLSWDEVHEDAEQIEHDVSDRLLERIDAYLGCPQFDPHGDPIPQADGSFATRDERALALCPARTRFQVARVIEQEPAFLRYLTETGLTLNAKGTVRENRPETGIMVLALGRDTRTIALSVAEKILVTV